MSRTRLTGFNANKMAKTMMDNIVKEQNRRLIAYAEQRIMLIGENIHSYGSRNNMDDTGNLLDSLCWGVCYDGKMVQSGFYRAARASEPSTMHGWSTVTFADPVRFKQHGVGQAVGSWVKMDAGEPINGRQLAEAYLERAPQKCKSGQWMVFFAVCAKYWGYWEKGFNLRTGFGSSKTKFMHFSVMSQFYDMARADLKPAQTRIHVYVDKYASRSLMSRARKNLNG